MTNRRPRLAARTARSTAALLAVLAGGALLVQIQLNTSTSPDGPWPALARLYGYFTIWSNTAVALVCAAYALGWRVRPGILAAVAVYIAVVGLIYNTLLIGLHNPQGVGLVTDRVFHMATPLLFPAWWWLVRTPGQLVWRDLAISLPLPIIYALFSIVRGASTGKYPYFFLDVGKYGMGQVGINIAGLALLFAGLMALAILADRRRTIA
jgi:hypothetical protein